MTETEVTQKAIMALRKGGNTKVVRILGVVARRPCVTAAQIAAELGADPKSFGPWLSDLDVYGLLTRTGSGYSVDEVHRYSITGVGLAVLAVVEAVRVAEAKAGERVA